jgi:PAS domain S-box-containing protein
MDSDIIPTVMHPEDVKKQNAFVEKRSGNNERSAPRDAECRLRHVDGSWHWFHIRETPFKYAADGTVSQTLGIAQDITEQKLAELELRETEKLLAAIYNTANIGICMADERGTYVQVNPAYCDMYGYTAEEMLGKTFDLVASETDHDATWEFHEGFMAGELADETREFDVQHKDGTRFSVILKAALLTREDGRRFRVSAVTDITERKQVEEALRQSLKDLAEFKFALDEHCIVWIVNKESIITYVNDKFCEISKYSRSELIGQHRNVVSSGYHPQSFFDDMRETINRGRVWHGEVKLRAKDGSYFWVDSTVVPFLDEKGRSYQFITIRTDITARKRIEESLRESEERFRTMADNAPVMIWTSDANGHDTFQNKTLSEFTGRNIEQNRDLQWLDLVHPEDLPRCIELWEAGFAEHQRTSTQMRMLRADGTYRWVTDDAVPRFTPDGNFVGFIGTHMDITEQIEAAQTLRQMNSELERRVNERTADLQQQRAQLSALLDAMGEGVCYSDFSDGPTIRYVNRALAAMTGYSVDELIGQSGTILFANEPEAQEQAEAMLTAIAEIHAKRGTVWRGEGKMVRKTGSTFYAALTITAAAETDQDGKGDIHLGAVTIIRDITEEKQLQGHKSLFLANASHELRTPLTNFNTRLYLMRKQPEKFNEHQVVLERVCAQMTGLVEDLLDISRFERGILPIDLRQVAVQDIISDVIVIQQPEAQRKHITLTAELPNQPLYINADPARLTQVVVNLTINAINYTPENGIVQIGLSTDESDSTGFIAIRVCDSGVGIAPEHLEKIFEPFFRATEGSARGTGLGLSIARSIVELHSGSLTVESQPEQGSIFTVRLPISK